LEPNAQAVVERDAHAPRPASPSAPFGREDGDESKRVELTTRAMEGTVGLGAGKREKERVTSRIRPVEDHKRA
jgi:hypothetical protein